MIRIKCVYRWMDGLRWVVGVPPYVQSCNRELIAEGADAGFVKWEIGDWEGWARDLW